ncbi:baseplate J/gp47 family protein [Asaia bogorensis]|uniref:baseplate J/gp47 family protein n=1 Tax=Asaia bogorensis TaxID=91915 RepID=UPI00285DC7F7|nr:baseplate J/gp47 family protein [Asaia bogorensis]MDR6182063.1 putative phage protein gp47/JayE [Asaia bogorensis NBRC 16594]
MASISNISQLACTVSAQGISAPDYETIFARLAALYQGIFGSDVVLDNSTQDGQWIGIIAQAINASNASMIAAFNSFSPATAQGVGLSSVVKINGLTRSVPSFSTCDVIITGTVGKTISGGSVRDTIFGYTWSLPTVVVIPSSGSVTATATCTTVGAISLGPGTLTVINTPTLGWSNVTNVSSSAPGSPTQSDASLRVQQASSTMLPSQTVMDGLLGALLALPGVSVAEGYENDTLKTDSNGIPANSIAVVVEGGDASAIATIIANKKTMGTPTYGTTTETITDSAGISRTINFFRPASYPIAVQVNLTALSGYTDAIGSMIAAQISAYIEAQTAGSTIYTTRLYAQASLPDGTGGLTYDLSSIQMAANGGAMSTNNVVVPFNALPSCPTSSVNIVASGTT